MTGKDMLQGIQNLDAELIEESEFGTFGRGKARGFGKKKLLLILAAALIMATMTAAAAITRWTATMQYGDNGGTTQQISEQVKKQAEQSGLSATPTETKDGKKKAVSATDNGITVTLAQTLMDQYGGRAIFRIEGLQLEEGAGTLGMVGLPGGRRSDAHELGRSFLTACFGMPTTIPHMQRMVSRFPGWEKTNSCFWTISWPTGALNSASILHSLRMRACSEREMAVTFTGFGIQGEKFEDEGYHDHPRQLGAVLDAGRHHGGTEKWTPNAKVGDLWT